MRKEACFVNYEIDVQYLDDEPKKMKKNLIQTLDINSQSYIDPADLDIVLVVKESNGVKDYVLPDADRLENYKALLNRCHLIKVTKKEKFSTSAIGCCFSRIQDTKVVMAVIAVVVALCLAFWQF